MRLSAVLAGILLTLTGGFCYFAQIANFTFTDIAFPVGAAMVLAGAFIVLAYVLSGRHRRLTDTVLVEGIVTAVFGFTVLNNQVTDSMLNIFFGALTIICGAARISQSFDLSRYKPRDWAKVMPTSIVCVAYGMMMMMPNIVSSARQLYIVGAAFIVTGLSLLLYAMHMEKRTSAQRDAEAKGRAEAKRAAAMHKRAERDRLSSLSKEERDAEKKRIREEKKAVKEQQRIERIRKKEEQLEEKRAASSDTISFTKAESAVIKAVADKLGFTDENARKADEEAAAREAEAALKEKDDVSDLFADNFKAIEAATEILEEMVADDEIIKIAEREELKAAAAAEEKAAMEAHQEEESADEQQPLWPQFQKPVDIPSIREIMGVNSGEEDGEAPLEAPRKAINLDEIENHQVELVFDDIQLPEIKFSAEGGESWKRNEFIKKVDETTVKKSDFEGYEALKLEDLISEDMPRKKTLPEDDSKFTKTLSFTWTSIPKDELEIKKDSTENAESK